MNTPWDIFENLNECVYVSTYDTNELVYMNSYLRSVLKVNNNGYIGYPCYKMLQNKDAPCEFCTNCCLKENQYYEWVFYNSKIDTKFLIKDTLITWNNKKYRLEIAISLDNERTNTMHHYFSRNESIISEFLQKIYYSANPSNAINDILKYIGEKFNCERAYIFEFDYNKELCDNTFEWCKQDVTPQINFLQRVPMEGVKWWIDVFANREQVVINDLEKIKDDEPLLYSILKPQEISSLIVAPIFNEKELIGFLGVDNPDKKNFYLLSTLFSMLGDFMLSLLKRRNLVSKLEQLSYVDPLTSAFNRNALFDFIEKNHHANKLGIIYCDISGLKYVNDHFGHEAGDKLIVSCSNIIKNNLDTTNIFRIGGDEFIAIFPDIAQKEFVKNVNRLKQAIKKSENHIAVGHAWIKGENIDINRLIEIADQQMYEDKREYYVGIDKQTGLSRDRRSRANDYLSTPPLKQDLS